MSPPELAEMLGRVIDGRATDEQLADFETILTEREPNAGPQWEEIFVAHTDDGFTIDLTGRRKLRDHAAVPEAVTGPDGRTRLFHVQGDLAKARTVARTRDPWMRTHGLLGFGAIDLLVGTPTSTFELERRFAVHGIVVGMVVDPTVRRLPDGRWRMYYVGVPLPELVAPGAWDDGADHTIYSAVSADLLTWNQEGEVVRGPNADPAVWCDGEDCLMVSTGLDVSHSTDGGRTFTFGGTFDVPGFAPAFLELPDGRVRLFYNTKDKGGALRSMVSVDRGRTWVTEPGNRVPAYTLEAPSFEPDPAGGWWVYYHYWVEGTSPDHWQDGYLKKTGRPAVQLR